MPAKTDKMKGKNKGSNNKSIIQNAVSSSLETQDHAGDTTQVLLILVTWR